MKALENHLLVSNIKSDIHKIYFATQRLKQQHNYKVIKIYYFVLLIHDLSILPNLVKLALTDTGQNNFVNSEMRYSELFKYRIYLSKNKSNKVQSAEIIVKSKSKKSTKHKKNQKIQLSMASCIFDKVINRRFGAVN